MIIIMYTAVIVEPRKHPALGFVLQNFLHHLSDQWKILIFHGIQNKEFVQDILSNLSDPSRILPPIELGIDNLTAEQYNRLLTSKAFYQCIPTEILLVFQTDTILLHATGLEDFLRYDYVGAPWLCGDIGNGGLSLRKKNKMIAICEQVPRDTLNEDVHISYQCVIPLYKPSLEEAVRFSVETVFYDNPIGIHAPWKYLPFEQLLQLCERYPIILELIRLQNT